MGKIIFLKLARLATGYSAVVSIIFCDGERASKCILTLVIWELGFAVILTS